MKNLIIYYIVGLIVIVSLCHCQHDDVNNDKNSTTTTTAKPKTTTTTTTTTTPKPTPTPISTPIVEGNITNGKDYICLRYHFSLLMRLGYLDQDNKTHWEDVWLPKDSHVQSDNCSNENSESFWFEFGNQKQSLLKMTFERNEASVYLSSIYAKIKMDNKSINKTIILNVTQPNPNFNVDKSHSYVCANNVTIETKDDDNHELVSKFLFSNITMQAFMKQSQNGTFSEEHNCQNEINDVVPIAVGAALTALVIIVMIAYFIGRRRSRRLAYQSV